MVAQLPEAPGDAARDRAGRELEGVADRAVALVAGEEAVEDLPARLRQPRDRLVHSERLVQIGQDRLLICRQHVVRRPLAALRGDAVEAEPARELADPRLDGGVVAERV